MRPDPTRKQFDAYRLAFDYFNRTLFGGELPHCLLNFSRLAKSAGFFAAHRWTHVNGVESTHEISLNPDVLDLPAIEIMQTLVHEMCHLWQEEFGEPSRRTYHNREWAAKMEAIGLMPSDTGKPGGKKTGQNMQDYVIEFGPFQMAFTDMPEKALLPWTSRSLVRAQTQAGGKRRGPTKFECPQCHAKAWGKPGSQLTCTPCNKPLVGA
jgi:hypothetical protein